MKRFLAVADRSLYAIDVVLGAAMTRSYSLVDGFITAFDAWNPIVAATLIRMQIDSPIRVAYMATADSGDAVAKYVLKGGEFRKLKDPSGKTLTDRRLLELAAPSIRGLMTCTRQRQAGSTSRLSTFEQPGRQTRTKKA